MLSRVHAVQFGLQRFLILKLDFFSYVSNKKTYIRLKHMQAVTGSLLDVLRYTQTTEHGSLPCLGVSYSPMCIIKVFSL